MEMRESKAKRPWAEDDWVVAMAAQSFVAVYADVTPQEPPAAPKKKEQSKRKTKVSAKKRLRRKSKATQATEEKEDEAMEESVTEPAAASFWLAQLQDDVTEEMLKEEDASVRVTWLNRKPESEMTYEWAYDEAVDVQAILCHVFLVEIDDSTLELTAKSLARINRSLERTRTGNDTYSAEDEEDDETAPRSSRKSKRKVKIEEGDNDGEEGRPRRSKGSTERSTSSASKKRKTKNANLHIVPRYTSVALEKYIDRELFGENGVVSNIKDDPRSAAIEVIRAVLTKNHKLLKRLTTNKSAYKEIHSFSAAQSADVRKTAFQYAIEANDITAVSMLLKARAIDARDRAGSPEISLPSHSTGKHTSSFSDYNRRAINASRGGKEGNNALLEDARDSVLSEDEETNFIWRCKTATPQMLTVLFPTRNWGSSWDAPYKVERAAHIGNYKLTAKLIELLSVDGWGFNDLHLKVLSDNDEPLPVFRSVSVIKMAQHTRVRPLHLAAINPNVKYLQTLWESIGDEVRTAKDTSGFEPIHYAAVCESTGPLKFLLEQGQGLLVKTKSRHSPLMRALSVGREETAMFMLEHTTQDEDMLRKLITDRGPSSYLAIHFAAESGCPKVIEKLVSCGADINSVTGDKSSALLLAAKHGHFDCVKILLEHHAKVDLGNKLKKTPLMMAVKNGHTRIAAMLINHDANVNAFDSSENSVAHYAASYGWLSCVELLMDAGADFWSKNSWGFVPLSCALLKQRPLCTDFIFERDTARRFLDFRDRQGCTMLFLQCKHTKSLAQIKYLLNKGLSPNICDSENEYPLQKLISRASLKEQDNQNEASQKFYEQAIRLLLENGANVQYDISKQSSADSDDASKEVQHQPLQLAIVGQQRNIFMLMLTEYKADPCSSSSNGADAWMVAASLGSDGDFYLEALLDHHMKTNRGEKIEFSGRQGPKANVNFFHIVARNKAKSLLSPDLVKRCVENCAEPSKLFNAIDESGQSPLIQLLQNRRTVNYKNISGDILDSIKASDRKYCELVTFFAEHTTLIDACIRYRDENELKKEKEAASQDENVFVTEVNDKQGTEKSWIKYETALHIAANCKLTKDAQRLNDKWFGSNLVEILLDKRAEVCELTDIIDFPDYTCHKTPLTYAVETNDWQSADQLLRHGANVNPSTVHCVICKNLAFQEETSCDCRAELWITPLYRAVKNGNTSIARLLLKRGARVSCFEKESRYTPLHLALSANNSVLTSLLLEHGADLSEKSTSGASALHRAIYMKHSVSSKQPHEGEVTYTDLKNNMTTKSSVAKSDKVSDANLSAIEAALRDPRAKFAVDAPDKLGRTPIHLAAENRDIQLLRALVKVCSKPTISVNTRDNLQRTPLHYAVNAATMSSDASFEVERFLLESGADANCVDKFKMSALHFALLKIDFRWQSEYDKREQQKVVSKSSGDATTNDGESDYEAKKLKAFRETLAKIPKNETDPVETVSNLASVRGIDVTQQDLLGRTPLHLAGATGAFVSASTLLSKFSSELLKQNALKIQDEDKFTPLGRAVLHLRQTAIMTLLQSNADVSGKIRLTKPAASDESNLLKKHSTYSYFYFAVQNSLTGICHMLLSARFCRRQAMEDAVRCGQFQLAANLMAATEVLNDSTILTRVNDDGDTLLHTLAKVDKPFDEMARTMAWTMLDSGLSATQRNYKGNSALHYAARAGNIHLMDFLLHNKCELNQTNNSGESPLLFMLKKSKRSNGDVLRALKYLNTKSDINLHIKDVTGMNVLTAYLDRFADSMIDVVAHFKWIETLLKKGVNPNGLFTSRSRKKFVENASLAGGSHSTVQVSALIRLVYAPSVYVRFHAIALLLRYGAKITVTDSSGNSLLLHLLTKNLEQIVQLVLGKIPTIPDVIDAEETRYHKMHIPADDIRSAVTQKNQAGQTPLHVAVNSQEYASFENGALAELLLDLGGDPNTRDRSGRSALDYARDQASRFMFRLMKIHVPDVVKESEETFFQDGGRDDVWMEAPQAPDSAADAKAYLLDCEAKRKIKRVAVVPKVHPNCDVGALSRVFSPMPATASADENNDTENNDGRSTATGEELDLLLTKVDVRNGRFGLNVFYRMQLVHDEIQGLFVLFTNWGRIGESGKFQNTPFHSEEEAVQEFQKIFRSKTGNHWKERHDFVKHSGKYNLVQRVNVHTTLDKSITAPILNAASATKLPAIRSAECAEPRVVEMLTAITDIQNLQLAATETCDYHDDLPLAKEHELRAAVSQLCEIRDTIEARNKVSDEIQNASAQLATENSSALSDLSAKHSDLTEKISELSSRYYEVMPCNEDAFGASIRAFDSVEDVNKEITRLRMLISISQTYQVLLGAKHHQKKIHPLEYCFNALQVRVSPLAQTSEEAKLVSTYFFNGLKEHSRSSYRISNIFDVDRRGETERFQDYVASHDSMRNNHSELLWHGTRRTNLMGILSQGLRIAPPEAPHQGYAYGKGLYFANVATKSLNYCDSPYLITSGGGAFGKSDSESRRERKVHYLLLCEVALGNSTRLSTPTYYEKVPENIESVHVLAEHIPDPTQSLVSPLSGARLSVGPVGRVGVVIPFDKLWAKTECTPQPTSWYERDPKFTAQTQDFLDKLVAKLSEGESFELEKDTDKELFVLYNFGEASITVQMLEKQIADDKVAPPPSLSAKCDATMKVTIGDYSYHVKRYRQATPLSMLADGYTMSRLNYTEYAELIVYNEAQARIRYLVEVESL